MEQTPFERYRKEDGTVGLFLPSIAEAAGLTRVDANDLEVGESPEPEAPDTGADTGADTAETEDAAPKARNRR